MRLDPDQPDAFLRSGVWQTVDLSLNAFRPVDPEDRAKGSIARSFSGGERNRLFLQTDSNFKDVSLISGADSRSDGRSFVFFDYNRDGWLDLGVTSPLNPRFQLFQNLIGKTSKNQVAFVKLRGGHHGTKRQTKKSSRDAIGAKLMVRIGDQTRAFLRSCGEGLASQNSSWIPVSMGAAEFIDEISVRWPSGKVSNHSNIKAQSRVLLYEDGSMEIESGQ